MTRKWKCVRYLRSYPSQLSVWSIFGIHIYVWESSVQDWYRDWSQSTKTAFVWSFRRKIWPILTAIRKSFCVYLWRWIKHGFTIILRNYVMGQNSEINLENATISWQSYGWCFLDAHGVISIDYLEKRRTITGAYYAALLDRLVDEIRNKQRLWRRKKSFSWWQCIISHIAHCPGKKHELGFESLPHPPYSPDLTPSDYYLFENFKQYLYGRRFESNEEVEWETEGYFGGFDKSYCNEVTVVPRRSTALVAEVWGNAVQHALRSRAVAGSCLLIPATARISQLLRFVGEIRKVRIRCRCRRFYPLDLVCCARGIL